jgi:signal transduction histidine kinase/DNA-binding response OmpR family regulator
VIELGSLETFSATHLDFLNQLTESIGIVVNTIETNTRTEELLAQSQSLAGELKIQQEELRRTNDELQDKALLLVKQKNEVEAKNKEVEEARRSLEEKAEQLTLTSKYKSEFLANMSHELRTPLNSLLILAQQLYENAEGNLNEKQTRYAKTIHSCGDDLLQLINDILDLSKIESGFITANISKIRFAEISSFVETTFKPLSEAKNLKFRIEVDASLPEEFDTDSQRLNQILKNLLSNSFKFTEKGEIKLKIYAAKKNWKVGNLTLDKASKVVAFSIVDSGIGIPQDKQSIIFEAFQQAEGSTSRKYGGTGLGLSISRGLAELLGGTIELESEVGQGSAFTLYLPMDSTVTENTIGTTEGYTVVEEQKSIDEIFNSLRIKEDGIEFKKLDRVDEMINETGDDRMKILPTDKVVLVIEDDLRFGKIMIDRAHQEGLKVVIATNYVDIFNFAARYKPIAITLDVKLPDTSGWKVLDLLKNDLNYRHTPIHLISGEENKMLALKRGARSFLLKPLNNRQLDELFADVVNFNNKTTRELLIIEDNELESSEIVKVLAGENIHVTIADTGKKALELLENNSYDSIIVDYTLPDISGMDLLTKINSGANTLVPVIVYSAKDFTRNELASLNKLSSSIVLKGVNSLDTLLEETMMYLHVNYTSLSPQKRRLMENIRMKNDTLSGKKVLVVDDDVRNLFAITTVFERYNINVLTAESGKEAIELIGDPSNNIEMVLMDIMMPEMDGYETMQKIRREHKNNTLPIIAVTAKAMKGDRQKCLEAGASDYITKPLKMDQLLSMMRIWFHK